MKKQLVDYSGFSLRKLNDPRFSHLKLLWSWIAYFILYFLTENLIPAERCHPIHCALDDIIPFNEFFVIFYVAWFLFIFGSLAYTLFYDVPRFKKLQVFLMITQGVAMLCYILYPNRQDLRPEVFPRENLLTDVVRFLYSFDTNTGVCPSLHVAYSLGVLSVGLKDEHLSWWIKAAMTMYVLLVCMAVCFVKQHSAVDVFAGFALALLAEIIVYGKDYWLPKLRGEKQ